MIDVCLVFLLLSAAGDPVTPIPVAVFAPEDVSGALVQRICAEAEAIWVSAGIVFEWHRFSSRDEARASSLEVTIDDRPTRVAPHGALGWLTFTAGRPDPSILLSRACAEGMLRETPELSNFTVSTHETLVGRMLGRALAHELGHYLLRSTAHAPHGLMRASWTSGELLESDRDGFELTSEQRAAAIRIRKNQ